MSKHRLGSILAIFSGFLYGFIGYFGISVIKADFSVTNMLFWRFLISSIVILLVCIPHFRHRKDSWTNIGIAFLVGAIFYSFSTMLFFYASYYVGSGLAMVIFFSYPVMVIVINYFFYKLHIPKLYYVASAIVLLGMVLFVDTHEVKMDSIGVSLGIASALFYAVYMVASKKTVITPSISALMVSLGCMVTALICTILNGTWGVPTTLDVWINLMGIGVFATAIPILLLLYSLKYISSDKASLLSVLEPVFVVIFGIILLGEELTLKHALGVVVVLTGAMMTLFASSAKLPEEI